MKKLYILIALSLLASSCQKSIEDRAEQEAREYTEKLCPTPIQNYTRTDSLTFDRESKTFNYYTSLFDLMDDEEIIKANKQQLHDDLLKAIVSSTQLKAYKDCGFSFRYIIRSGKNPRKIHYDVKYTEKDYQK